MTPGLIFRNLHIAGIYVRAEDGKLLVSPMSLLTSEDRQLLQDHKPELIDFLQSMTLVELLEAADRVCGYYGDGAQARADMRADVLATPSHLQADLLDHFNSLLKPQIFHANGDFGAATASATTTETSAPA